MAQNKPAIAIIELDLRNPEAFSREFFPLAAKVFAEAGGTFLVRPSAPTAVDDVAPKRVAVIRFESAQKALETLASQAYRDARKIGDQHASFRIYVVELASP
jgi:uncharacterized protein (DUF1330 family)